MNDKVLVTVETPYGSYWQGHEILTGHFDTLKKISDLYTLYINRGDDIILNSKTNENKKQCILIPNKIAKDCILSFKME